jgi:hypothetical protein
MSQISRPFQITLLVVGVLALVWLFALQGKPATTNSAPTAAPVVSTAAPAAPSGAAQAQAAAAPTTVYHGAAPGVEGLTRAINNAHKAVATSQTYVNKIEQKSAQAGDEPAQATTSPSPSAAQPSASHSTATRPTAGTSAKAAKPSASAKAHVTSPAASKPAVTPASKTTTKAASNTHTSSLGATKAPKTGSSTHSASKASLPAGQLAVEAQLAHGDVVALLFWNPQSPADVSVRQELQLLLKVHHSTDAYLSKPEVKGLVKAFGPELNKKLALDEASASQATEYGVITHGIQIYNTPTLLIIDKQGKTIVMNGLQDLYSIQQTIDEARNS